MLFTLPYITTFHLSFLEILLWYFCI